MSQRLAFLGPLIFQDDEGLRNNGEFFGREGDGAAAVHGATIGTGLSRRVFLRAGVGSRLGGSGASSWQWSVSLFFLLGGYE